MKNAIELNDICKTFRIRKSGAGFFGALKSLGNPDYTTVEAVKDVSFAIKPGERVAFVGPNGAGKSTTIKMLSGILHPTSGEASVFGYTPWKDREKLAYNIGCVFGQKSQLWYHLPPTDTFDLLSKIYDLEPQAYKKRRDQLVEQFNIGDLMDQPVRQMSLGQRMRCEIVASLMHKPKVLFLDEPTIGLDVTAKAIIRDIVKKASEEEGTTILLTSHDTGDMEQVCDRVIIIDMGQVLLDQPVKKLKSTYIRKKQVTLSTRDEKIDLKLAGVTVVSHKPFHTVLDVDLDITPVEKVMAAAVKIGGLRDITIEDPPMEDVIRDIYADQQKKR